VQETGCSVRVLGIAWIGVRSAQASALRTLFGDVMGMSVVRDDPSAARFRLADGVRVDVYSHDDAWHAFFGTAPAVGFLVDDAAAARVELEAVGMTFLSDMQRDGREVWAHFRGPDGNVYEILSRH
jgi:catechol 2,3-dioxygenase-like lactoylglutathione lyase family enzyme